MTGILGNMIGKLLSCPIKWVRYLYSILMIKADRPMWVILAILGIVFIASLLVAVIPSIPANISNVADIIAIVSFVMLGGALFAMLGISFFCQIIGAKKGPFRFH